MFTVLDGYKTYTVAVVSIVWALYGMWAGFISMEVGSGLISTALLASGLRHGISKS